MTDTSPERMAWIRKFLHDWDFPDGAEEMVCDLLAKVAELEGEQVGLRASLEAFKLDGERLLERITELEAERDAVLMENVECGARDAKRIAELEADKAQADKDLWRMGKLDDQLEWLAVWCKRKTGVHTNKVIGKEGWPSKLVEVVAQAIEQKEASKGLSG